MPDQAIPAEVRPNPDAHVRGINAARGAANPPAPGAANAGTHGVANSAANSAANAAADAAANTPASAAVHSAASGAANTAVNTPANAAANGAASGAANAVANTAVNASANAAANNSAKAAANAATDPALEPATVEFPVTQPPEETSSGPQAPKPPVSPVRRLVQLVRANLPFLLVLLVAAAAFLRIVQNHWRQGSTLLGCALLLAALLRALLPDDQTGLIVVRRSRLVDVLSYAALGACMVFVSLTIQGGPFDR